MSQKITSKNLSYNQSLPPFLAALRAQTSSSGPDPILASRRRPAVARSGSAEQEDLPLVVDDQGYVVDDASVGKDGTVSYGEGLKDDGEDGDDGAETKDGGGEKGKGGDKSDLSEKISSLGPVRKRRAGKVIGGDEEGSDIGKVADQTERKIGGRDEPGVKRKSGEESEKTKGSTKGKKKAKKIKLSFDDDE
jgi:hypothetical protein